MRQKLAISKRSRGSAPQITLQRVTKGRCCWPEGCVERATTRVTCGDEEIADVCEAHVEFVISVAMEEHLPPVKRRRQSSRVQEVEDPAEEFEDCPICMEADHAGLQVLHTSGPDTDEPAIAFARKARHAAIEFDLATFISIALESSGAVSIALPDSPEYSVAPLMKLRCSYEGVCETLAPDKWCGACVVKLLAKVVGDDQKPVAEA